MKRPLTFWAMVALLLTACGGGPATQSPVPTQGPASPTSPTVPASSRPAGSMVVATDLPYHDDTSEAWVPPLVDVYAPEGARGLPVVVIFHGGMGAPSKGDLAELATQTASKGAVVFVPNRGIRGLPTKAADAAAWSRKEVDGDACAIAYAEAKAPEYGGDPGRLVVFGHSAGGQMGATAALRGPQPFPACAVEPVPFEVRGLVTWDGDFLLGGNPPAWDVMWGKDMALVIAEATPWRWLAKDNPPKAILITSAHSPEPPDGLIRSWPDSTGDWMATRDPDGAYLERLRALGALDDGAIDSIEGSDLMASFMRDLSYDVTRIMLPDSGHDLYELSDDDARTIVNAILEAGRP